MNNFFKQIDWQAVSSICTAVAVIVALYVVFRDRGKEKGYRKHLSNLCRDYVITLRHDLREVIGATSLGIIEEVDNKGMPLKELVQCKIITLPPQAKECIDRIKILHGELHRCI